MRVLVACEFSGVVRQAFRALGHACSMLYGAAWRVARELGYSRLITYTLPEEGGASLRASGWKLIGERGGGNWNCASRPRIDTAVALQGQKLLWEAIA